MHTPVVDPHTLFSQLDEQGVQLPAPGAMAKNVALQGVGLVAPAGHAVPTGHGLHCLAAASA